MANESQDRMKLPVMPHFVSGRRSRSQSGLAMGRLKKKQFLFTVPVIFRSLSLALFIYHYHYYFLILILDYLIYPEISGLYQTLVLLYHERKNPKVKPYVHLQSTDGHVLLCILSSQGWFLLATVTISYPNSFCASLTPTSVCLSVCLYLSSLKHRLEC